MNLKQIQITNARRFGKDIVIDFVPGANIILAPNGTGKTTVFEAIEFALTGSILRLDNPPLSLIRDNQPEMKIRLDFDNGKHCEVVYKKGSFPVRTGDYDYILAGRTAEEIPYLLRLTHLLEQRANSWFVQQDKGGAGSFLDKLSIGRDLSTILSTKTSAIRAANQQMENLKAETFKNEDELKQFETLLGKRNMVSYDFVLVPIEKLLDPINEATKYLDVSKTVDGTELSKLIALNSQLLEVVIQRATENSAKQVILSKLDTLIAEYKKLSETLTINGKSLFDGNKELQVVEKAIAEQYKKQEATEINLKNIESEIKQIITKRDNFGRIETLKVKLISVNADLSILKTKETSLKTELEKINSSIQIIENLSEKFNVIDKNIVSLTEKRSDLIAKKEKVKLWHQLIDKLKEIENVIITDLNSRKAKFLSELEPLNIDYKTFSQELSGIQSAITSLKSATGKVQEAVAIISTNLDEKQGDCPVCGEEYSPIELRKRINGALEYINPVLVSNLESETKLLEKINPLKEKIALHNKGIEEADLLLTKAQMDARSIEVTINSDIKKQFPDINTPDIASIFIEAELKTIDESINSVKVQRASLAALPDNNVVQEIMHNKAKTTSDLSHVSTQLIELTNQCNQISNEISDINSTIGATTLEQINIAFKTNNDQLTNLQKERNLIDEGHARSIAMVKRLKEQMAQFDAQIMESKVRLSEIQATWSESKLPLAPDNGIKEEYALSISKEKAFLEKIKIDLLRTNEELARWKSADEYQKLDKEIKHVIGSKSEETYLTELKSKAQSSQDRVKSTEEKRKILNDIYTSVSGERNAVNQYIDGMNSTWSSMLKRVVVNPIFANTELTSYQKNNKSQADIHISLHGEQTKVTDVASEAQITDLQLTFLLAMANRYQWSPWRGLLLDDPTQHHDLVHAASVFDLLRDFMTTQKSQIILGTHDSVHANFFKRKCQNDNIPVSVWHLMADSNGVKAELRQ